MTPTAQQIREQTNAIDRVAKGFEALDYGPLANDIATLKEMSARWNKNANHLPTTPQSNKLNFGWVSHDTTDQLASVSAIGGKRVRQSGWPGGASEAFKNVVKTNLVLLPCVMREQNGNKAGLEPLFSAAAIDAERARHARDISFYSDNDINRIEFGNEWDLKRYWNGPVDQVATTYAQHFLPMYHNAGIEITLALPLNPLNVTPFLLNFKATDCLKYVKRFSMHPYQGNAASHTRRASDILAAVQTVIPSATLNDIDVTEFGLQRGGSDDDFMVEIKSARDWYASQNYTGTLYAYRISVTERPESKRAPFKDGLKTATFDRWKAMK